MATCFHAARRSLPLLTLAAGAGFEVVQRRNEHNEGTLTCFNTTVTSCEAVPKPTPITADLAKPAITSFPIPKKQFPPAPLNTRTWLEHEEVVTKTKKQSFPWSKKKENEHVTDVYLLGVFHGSNKSAQRVKLLLETVEPDVVFVELCPERTSVLHRSPEEAKNTPFRWTPFVKYAYVNGMGVKHSLSLLCMARIQHWFAKHGAGPGGEFRAAWEYAKSQQNGKRPVLILGDRPQSFTVGRLVDLGKPSSASRCLRASEELYGSKPPRAIDMEGLDVRGQAQLDTAYEEQTSWADFVTHGIIENEDLLALGAFSDDFGADIQFPEGTEMRVGVQERDIFMVSKLVQWCHVEKPKRVVVIIGAGHLRGMAHLLDANIIGTEREPEEVVLQLLASEKYPEDHSYLKGVASGFAWHNLND